jgi:serine/threonine-protein kinase RsbW
MTKTLSLTIRNEFPQLELLVASVNQFAEEQEIAPDQAYKLNLALEEMVSNIIKYGYDDSGVHDIHVAVTIDNDRIHLRLEDDGHEFNPLSLPAPDTQKPLAQREVGGLGIHLVRNMCDEVRYSRMEERNILDIEILRKGGKSAPAIS